MLQYCIRIPSRKVAIRHLLSVVEYEMNKISFLVIINDQSYKIKKILPLPNRYKYYLFFYYDTFGLVLSREWPCNE